MVRHERCPAFDKAMTVAKLRGARERKRSGEISVEVVSGNAIVDSVRGVDPPPCAVSEDVSASTAIASKTVRIRRFSAASFH